MILRILVVIPLFVNVCMDLAFASLGPESVQCFEACLQKYNGLHNNGNATSCEHGCMLSPHFGFIERDHSCEIWCTNRITTPGKIARDACIYGCNYDERKAHQMRLTIVIESQSSQVVNQQENDAIDDVLLDPGLRSQFHIPDLKIPSTYYTNLPSFLKDSNNVLRRSGRLCRDVWSRWSSLMYFIFIAIFFIGLLYGFRFTPTQMLYSYASIHSTCDIPEDHQQLVIVPDEKPPAYSEKPHTIPDK